jgi:hypothetical protein
MVEPVFGASTARGGRVGTRVGDELGKLQAVLSRIASKTTNVRFPDLIRKVFSSKAG